MVPGTSRFGFAHAVTPGRLSSPAPGAAGSGAAEGQRERRGQRKAEKLGLQQIYTSSYPRGAWPSPEHPHGCCGWVVGTWRGPGEAALGSVRTAPLGEAEWCHVSLSPS